MEEICIFQLKLFYLFARYVKKLKKKKNEFTILKISIYTPEEPNLRKLEKHIYFLCLVSYLLDKISLINCQVKLATAWHKTNGVTDEDLLN